MIATLGVRAWSASGYFLPVAGSEMTANGVTSAPVPDLVLGERLEAGRDQTVHGDRGVGRGVGPDAVLGPHVLSGHGGVRPLSGTAVLMRRRGTGGTQRGTGAPP